MLQTFNPFTGKLIKNYPENSDQEVTSIIDIQHNTYDKWKITSLDERTKLIAQLGKTLMKEQESLAQLITAEMGKPITESRAEIAKCSWLCEYYAENGASMLENKLVITEARSSYISFEPMGIIFAIMPWNFPLWQALRFAVPTILAGNVVLLKHAPNVNGTSLRIEEIFREAGFPEHIFRSVFIQADRSEMIIKNKFVRGVTITGSGKAGSSVASLAGKYLKKCVLELGGSDPLIVFEDAGLASCCQAATDSRMINAGKFALLPNVLLCMKVCFRHLLSSKRKPSKI